MGLLFSGISLIVGMITALLSGLLVVLGFLKRRNKKKRERLRERYEDNDKELSELGSEYDRARSDSLVVEDRLTDAQELQDNSMTDRLDNLSYRIEAKKAELQSRILSKQATMFAQQVRRNLAILQYVFLVLLGFAVQGTLILLTGWVFFFTAIFLAVSAIIPSNTQARVTAGANVSSCYVNGQIGTSSTVSGSGTLGEQLVEMLKVMAENESGNANPGKFLGVLDDGAGGNWGTYSHTTHYTLKSLLIFFRDYYPQIFAELKLPIDVNLDSGGSTGSLASTSIDSSSAFRESFQAAGQKYEKEMREAEAIHIFYFSSLPAINTLRDNYEIDLLDGKTPTGVVRVYLSVAHQYGSGGGPAFYSDLYKQLGRSFADLNKFAELLPQVAYSRASVYRDAIRERYVREGNLAKSFTSPFTITTQFGTDLASAMGKAGVSSSSTRACVVGSANEVGTDDTTTGAIYDTKVTFIGDSLMDNSITKQLIQSKLPKANIISQVGKHFAIDSVSNRSALAIFEEKAKSGELGEVVVIGAATNSAFAEKDIDKLISLIPDSVKYVYLVNTMAQGSVTLEHRQQVDELIKDAVSKSSKIKRIDAWGLMGGDDAFSKYNSGDNVHFNNDGAKLYAETIMKAIGVK